MNNNPTQKELRKFKITLLLLPIIPAVILYYKHHTDIAVIVLAILWGLLSLLFVADLFGKNIDKPIYVITHKLLQIIGIVLSVIALIITWFCSVLPTAIIAKIMKRDRLALKKQNVKSYWKNVKETEPTYENQY